MSLFIVGLVLFLAVHSLSIVASGWRDAQVARLGANAWRGIYSVLSLVGLVLLVAGFGQARVAPAVLYAPPGWLHHVTFLLMLPVFPLLLAAYLPGRIQRTLKHPFLVAVKLWALAHLLSNGSLPDVLLFGAFLAWAVADRISLKSRPPRAIAAAPPGRWNDAIAVLGGLLLYALFVIKGHALLIGVSPLG